MKNPVVIVLDETEAEELAAILTVYCDLDPDPEIVALRAKVALALVDQLDDEIEERVH